MEATLVLHVAATFFMTGIIWFVQVVHYPLFQQVGREEFSRYERANVRRTWSVVIGPMTVELITGVLLLWQTPKSMSGDLVWLNIILLLLIWFSTIFLQIPQHRKLSVKFEERTFRSLVLGNWLRTAAWSWRAMLMFYVIT